MKNDKTMMTNIKTLAAAFGRGFACSWKAHWMVLKQAPAKATLYWCSWAAILAASVYTGLTVGWWWALGAYMVLGTLRNIASLLAFRKECETVYAPYADMLH